MSIISGKRNVKQSSLFVVTDETVIETVDRLGRNIYSSATEL